MEVNTLMKTVTEKAGLDNFHLTNYSAQTRIIQTKQSRARSFYENKLVRKYSTSAPSMKNYIYILHGRCRRTIFTHEFFFIKRTSAALLCKLFKKIINLTYLNY